MSVATEGTGALAVTTAVIAAIVTNRVKTAGIVAMTVGATAVEVKVKIVSVRSAVIAVMTVGASAVVIAGKIVSVASAVIVAKPAVRIAITRPKAMWPVADTTLATAPITHAKCAAIVVNEESVAARKAMTEAAARGGVKLSVLSERSVCLAISRWGDRFKLQRVQPLKRDDGTEAFVSLNLGKIAFVRLTAGSNARDLRRE